MDMGLPDQPPWVAAQMYLRSKRGGQSHTNASVTWEEPSTNCSKTLHTTKSLPSILAAVGRDVGPVGNHIRKFHGGALAPCQGQTERERATRQAALVLHQVSHRNILGKSVMLPPPCDAIYRGLPEWLRPKMTELLERLKAQGNDHRSVRVALMLLCVAPPNSKGAIPLLEMSNDLRSYLSAHFSDPDISDPLLDVGKWIDQVTQRAQEASRRAALDHPQVQRDTVSEYAPMSATSEEFWQHVHRKYTDSSCRVAIPPPPRMGEARGPIDCVDPRWVGSAILCCNRITEARFVELPVAASSLKLVPSWPHLRILRVIRNQVLEGGDLEALSGCPMLSTLDVSECPRLENFLHIRNLPRLTQIIARDCPLLYSCVGGPTGPAPEMDTTRKASLTGVALSQSANSLEDEGTWGSSLWSPEACLATLPGLTALEIQGCGAVNSLSAQLPSVISLDLSGLQMLQGLGGNFQSLLRLDMSYCEMLTEITPSLFHTCCVLEELTAFACPELTFIAGLSEARQLRRLRVARCPILASLGNIGMPSASRPATWEARVEKPCPRLTYLDLDRCPSLTPKDLGVQSKRRKNLSTSQGAGPSTELSPDSAEPRRGRSAFNVRAVARARACCNHQMLCSTSAFASNTRVRIIDAWFVDPDHLEGDMAGEAIAESPLDAKHPSTPTDRLNEHASSATSTACCFYLLREEEAQKQVPGRPRAPPPSPSGTSAPTERKPSKWRAAVVKAADDGVVFHAMPADEDAADTLVVWPDHECAPVIAKAVQMKLIEAVRVCRTVASASADSSYMRPLWYSRAKTQLSDALSCASGVLPASDLPLWRSALAGSIPDDMLPNDLLVTCALGCGLCLQAKDYRAHEYECPGSRTHRVIKLVIPSFASRTPSGRSENRPTIMRPVRSFGELGVGQHLVERFDEAMAALRVAYKAWDPVHLRSAMSNVYGDSRNIDLHEEGGWPPYESLVQLLKPVQERLEILERNRRKIMPVLKRDLVTVDFTACRITTNRPIVFENKNFTDNDISATLDESCSKQSREMLRDFVYVCEEYLQPMAVEVHSGGEHPIDWCSELADNRAQLVVKLMEEESGLPYTPLLSAVGVIGGPLQTHIQIVAQPEGPEDQRARALDRRHARAISRKRIPSSDPVKKKR